MNKKIIVSTHSNFNLEWLNMTHSYGYSSDNIVIYDRTSDDFPNKRKIDHLGKVIKSPNVGSNIYDIGRYILDNYNNLPDMNIFLKGNLFEKEFTSEKRFVYALNANWFVPLEGTRSPAPRYYRYFLNDNYFCIPMEWEQKNLTINPIFSEEDMKRTKTYPRISNFIEFLKDIFILDDEDIPTMISFAPGANYAVPKNCILKYSKNFYRKMMHYTDYNNNPVEAHWFERILKLAWNGCLEENLSYII